MAMDIWTSSLPTTLKMDRIYITQLVRAASRCPSRSRMLLTAAASESTAGLLPHLVTIQASLMKKYETLFPLVLVEDGVSRLAPTISMVTYCRNCMSHMILGQIVFFGIDLHRDRFGLLCWKVNDTLTRRNPLC